MRGWTPDGAEIELTVQQEQAVRAMLAGHAVTLGRGTGKGIVLATVNRILGGKIPDGIREQYENEQLLDDRAAVARVKEYADRIEDMPDGECAYLLGYLAGAVERLLDAARKDVRKGSTTL